VTSGIHRRLRHPSETGHLMLALGAAALLASAWAALWIAAVVLPLGLARMRSEERALIARLPAYARYRATTPALVPSTRRRAGSAAP
jgi:protein-S-isoprenylcysteine O-methyltransferase Ste14